jgi:hypothetical protein
MKRRDWFDNYSCLHRSSKCRSPVTSPCPRLPTPCTTLLKVCLLLHTCDVVTSLAFLYGMDSLPNLQDVVNHNLSMTTKDKPDIMRLLENEQRLRDAGHVAISLSAVALADRANRSVIACTNCRKNGCTTDCISPGGGMAGKTIEESCGARQTRSPSRRLKVQTNLYPKRKNSHPVRDTDGRALVVYLDTVELENTGSVTQ